MQPDTFDDPLTAGGEVVLPSAASSGGFVQVRTAPAPRIGCGCVLDGGSAVSSAMPAQTPWEAQHAR